MGIHVIDIAAPSLDEPVCRGYKEAVQMCSPLMCADVHCPNYPHAVCRINPCGKRCELEFYNEQNNKVDCTSGRCDYSPCQYFVVMKGIYILHSNNYEPCKTNYISVCVCYFPL